jgi:endonuclease-3
MLHLMIFSLIKSISYPNNKTKHLIGMANMLLEKFDGKVPMTVNELIQLPGVGRKTANVITSVIDEQPNMAVDTHVFRVSKRIGLVSEKATTPLAVEKELIKYIPEAHDTPRASLVNSSWPLCLHRPQSQMRDLPINRMVPIL